MTQQPINPKLKEAMLHREKLDLGSSTYRELKRYIEHRIDMLRKKNDNQISLEETNFMRGKIQALKGLLAKCEPNEALVEPLKVTK